MDTLSWLSASNVPPQIRPLNWAGTSVAHSRENCILWPWAYKARMYGGAAFQKPLLSNACAQRREKPGVRSSNSAPLSHEKIWAWMNLYEEFLDLSVQSRFPPQLSFKGGGGDLLVNEQFQTVTASKEGPNLFSKQRATLLHLTTPQVLDIIWCSS